jgi:ubiquinone/menaquinone biosynthesis C-methylase UbiE
MLGEWRAQRVLHSIETGTSNEAVKNVLEIGSGTGNFLAIATRRYERVVGVDIAMRWLHLSRRRFMDRGLPVPPLGCCCAEYLPFPDRSFDLIVAASTLEFLSDQDRALSECARTLGDSGALFVNTVNRYSLSKDPYAYLWGVGFLPRAWQSRYVRWRRGATYEYIKTLSLSSLHRLAEKHFATRKVSLPGVARASMQQFPKATRLQAYAYELLRTVPPFNKLLKWCGPGWDVMLHKGLAR